MKWCKGYPYEILEDTYPSYYVNAAALYDEDIRPFVLYSWERANEVVLVGYAQIDKDEIQGIYNGSFKLPDLLEIISNPSTKTKYHYKMHRIDVGDNYLWSDDIYITTCNEYQCYYSKVVIKTGNNHEIINTYDSVWSEPWKDYIHLAIEM